MSLFLITSSLVDAEDVRAAWTPLYDAVDVQPLSAKYFIVIARGCSDKPCFSRVSKDYRIYGFGTFFSDDGFGESALPSGWPAAMSDQSLFDHLYGHYIFVAATNDGFRLITDPVGLLNVYWEEQDGNLRISNSLMPLGIGQKKKSLSRPGVQQFVFRESTVGATTLLRGVSRLPIGMALHVGRGSVRLNRVFNHEPETLDFDEYCRRINAYFSAVAKYPGRVACELSAGFDTRLVAACAANELEGLLTITNDNPRDGGADEAVSSELALQMNLPHVLIHRDTAPRLSPALIDTLFHAFSVGREVGRSRQSLQIARDKYRHCNLILGGYGGEVLRGKNMGFSGYEDFAYRFYGDPHCLSALGLADEFRSNVKEVLSHEYSQPWIDRPDVLCNWLYCMDRMRIWGGGRVLMMSLFGDNIHPFMDWHLLAPIIGKSQDELHGGKLAGRIMTHFMPDAFRLPINPPRKATAQAGRSWARLNWRTLVDRVDRRFGLHEIAPGQRALINEVATVSGLAPKSLRASGGTVYVDRLRTVRLAIRSWTESPADQNRSGAS